MRKRFKGAGGAGNCEVRESSIKRGGFGVFATKPFREGDKRKGKEISIMLYRGEIIYTLLDSHKENDYIAELRDDNGDVIYMDASDENSCLGRYLNDPGPGKDQFVNAKIKWCSRRQCGIVVALTDINIGDEIFISYHDSYWNGREYNCF